MNEEQEARLDANDPDHPVYHICYICGVQIHNDYWDLHNKWHFANG
jgi:hypothetical protein